MKNRKVAYRALFLMLSASIVVACSKDDKPSQINPTTSQKVVVKNFEQKTSTEVAQPDMFSGTLNQDIKDQLFNELPLFGGGKDVENAQHDLEVALNRTYSRIEPGMEDFGTTSFSINASLVDGLLPNLEETRIITEAAIALTNVVLNASAPAKVIAIDVLADPIDATNAVFEIVVYTAESIIGIPLPSLCMFQEPEQTPYTIGARMIGAFYNSCLKEGVMVVDETIMTHEWDMAIDQDAYKKKWLYSNLPGINEPHHTFNDARGQGFLNSRWNYWLDRFENAGVVPSPPILLPGDYLEPGQEFGATIITSENATVTGNNYHKTNILYVKGRMIPLGGILN